MGAIPSSFSYASGFGNNSKFSGIMSQANLMARGQTPSHLRPMMNMMMNNSQMQFLSQQNVGFLLKP